MGHIERFLNEFERKAHTRNLEGFIGTGEVGHYHTHCCCGKDIQNVYTVRNKEGVEVGPIGCCCIKKFGGSTRKTGSYIDYFKLAQVNASNTDERAFMLRMMERIARYGSDIILDDYQWSWVEKLAGIPLPTRWKTRRWDTKPKKVSEECIPISYLWQKSKYVKTETNDEFLARLRAEQDRT